MGDDHDDDYECICARTQGGFVASCFLHCMRLFEVEVYYVPGYMMYTYVHLVDRSTPTILLHPRHQHAPKPFTPDVPRPASSSVRWATTLGQAGGLQRSRRVGPMRASERSVGRQTLMQDELFNWCWHGFAWGPPICQPAFRRPKPVSAPPRATQVVPPVNLAQKNKQNPRAAPGRAPAIAFHPPSPALFPHAVRTKTRRSRAPAHEAFESRANSTHRLVTRDYKIPFYRCHSQVTPHGAAQGIKHAQLNHVQTRSRTPLPHLLTTS
ncbi:hypothetical protein J3E73DRAFT_388829 [Bipolaris maydis]|nr:hypothetical protein J3E73DRAFT_388829 [Bipolaris maydis]